MRASLHCNSLVTSLVQRGSGSRCTHWLGHNNCHCWHNTSCNRCVSENQPWIELSGLLRQLFEQSCIGLGAMLPTVVGRKTTEVTFPGDAAAHGMHYSPNEDCHLCRVAHGSYQLISLLSQRHTLGSHRSRHQRGSRNGGVALKGLRTCGMRLHCVETTTPSGESMTLRDFCAGTKQL